MYLLIVFLPLFGAIIVGFGGRWLGYYGSSIISVMCIFFSMIFSILVFYEISGANLNVFIVHLVWFNVGMVEIMWSFVFDSLVSVMLLVITIISFCVHIYSTDYMSSDPHFPRFMAFLNIFTFFMLILVTADNLIQMFLGWEGVGLASYLLINFWFSRLAANKSAIKALLVNRIGDFGLLIAIFLSFNIFKSLNYWTIFSLTPLLNNFNLIFFEYQLHGITLIAFFLFIGAAGKSAQLLLHTWLPDAMEGPTPVSALIHAATMVTAGVFLLIRFSFLLEFSPVILNILVFIGSFTAFFAAMSGIFQHDLKKVIAYSTCSQLGYMVFCCGLSAYNISIFHLTNHAFFKALLFLSAGSVIHAVKDEQDMRKMGSLINFLPITYSVMLIGSLALTGFPFLTGFYSKDAILEVANIYRNSNLSYYFMVIACWLGNFSAFFTAFYSFRLLFLTFLNNANNTRVNYPIFESSFIMINVLLFLTFLSLVFGYLFKDFFIGMGTNIWNQSIFFLPSNSYLIESEFLGWYLKWCPFILSTFGFIIAFILNTNFYHINFPNLFTYFNWFFYLTNKKWFIDLLYNNLIIFPLLNFGYKVSFKNLDRGFIEIVGPFGLINLIPKLSSIFTNLQTGHLLHYLYFISFSVVIFILFGFFILNLNFFFVLFFFVLFFFI